MKRKIIRIVLLTALAILVIVLLPEKSVEQFVLPAMLGMMIARAMGEMPATTINKALHIGAFSPLLIVYLFFNMPVSAVSYAVGVLLQKIGQQLS